MKIRPATPADAPKMSALLEDLIAAGKRTNPGDLDYTMKNYVAHPDAIQCSVAEDADGAILGLQILLWAKEGNRFGTPIGWGIIGTHVSPSAARRGVGSRLFQATKAAAVTAEIKNIEAFIGETNADGLAYYEAMGFRTYRREGIAVCKCYAVC